MSTTIRTQIIAGFYVRAGEILTTAGFETNIGQNAYQGKAVGKNLPGVAVGPGREDSEKGNATVENTMEVTVSGFVAYGASDPTVVSEQILADIIEAFTGTEWTLTFSGGSEEVEVGDTITGATSGATGYVVDVDLTSGSWLGGDAAGTLTIRRASGDIQGGFTSGEVISEAGAASEITAISAENAETVVTGGMATSIVYKSGGAEEYPDGGQTVAGSAATFEVVYRTKAGNPYAQA